MSNVEDEICQIEMNKEFGGASSRVVRTFSDLINGAYFKKKILLVYNVLQVLFLRSIFLHAFMYLKSCFSAKHRYKNKVKDNTLCKIIIVSSLHRKLYYICIFIKLLFIKIFKLISKQVVLNN